MKKYDRFPIILDRHTVALLHIFTKYDNLEDSWMMDFEKIFQKEDDLFDESAKQFINQLEEHCTPEFIECLSLRCAKKYYDFCKETKQMKYWIIFLKFVNNIK